MDETALSLDLCLSFLRHLIEPHHWGTIATCCQRDGALTEEEHFNVMNCSSEKKADVIIRIVCDGNRPQLFPSLFVALRESGLNDIADALKNNSKSSTSFFQDYYLQVLKIYHCSVVSDLQVSDILDIYGPSLLDKHTQQKIEAGDTEMGRAGQLLYYIAKRPKKLGTFIDAMREYYPHLIDLLEGNEDREVTFRKLCSSSIEDVLEPLDLLHFIDLKPDTKKSICTFKSREERVKKFLYHVVIRNNWYKTLLDAVRRANDVQDKYSTLLGELELTPEEKVRIRKLNSNDSVEEEDEDAEAGTSFQAEAEETETMHAKEPASEAIPLKSVPDHFVEAAIGDPTVQVTEKRFASDNLEAKVDAVPFERAAPDGEDSTPQSPEAHSAIATRVSPLAALSEVASSVPPESNAPNVSSDAALTAENDDHSTFPKGHQNNVPRLPILRPQQRLPGPSHGSQNIPGPRLAINFNRPPRSVFSSAPQPAAASVKYPVDPPPPYSPPESQLSQPSVEPQPPHPSVESQPPHPSVEPQPPHPSIEPQHSSPTVEHSSAAPASRAETPLVVHQTESAPQENLSVLPRPELPAQNSMTTSPTVSHAKTSSPGQLPKLALRDYQLELAQPALEGQNTMIVAPTGSGKTYVAVKICMNHIEQDQLKSKKKVVFLVPRVPLVTQQCDLLKKFLGDRENLLFRVTGETSSKVPVHISMDNHVITVMTAQILLNLLREKLVKITDITLLIIDECHHTIKNDPYNNIMRIYLDERLGSNGKDLGLPQIVGLTASPGLGKAKRMSDAETNIKTLMANLDVTSSPTRVEGTMSNLRRFQNEANEVHLVVSRASEDPFANGIHKSMDAIQDLIEKEINANSNDLEGDIQFDLRARQGNQDYEAWALSLKNKSKKLCKNSELSYCLMTYADQLVIYNTALMLNDHVRSGDAYDYLNEELFKNKSQHRTRKDLKQIYESNVVRRRDELNPLLRALRDELEERFREKSESRCIIFAKTRAIAQGLVQFLKEDEKLDSLQLQPKFLTGAGARGEIGGMTKPGQDDTLLSFKQGKCKVIVATSVAEEGLDIEACNLIINYNYSTNEIGQIQRKGRGRAKDSRVIMLAYDDSGHVRKERENKTRVTLTSQILDTIRDMHPEKLKEEIRKIQKKSKSERDLENRMRKRLDAKKTKKQDLEFDLLCLWCKKPATKSTFIRHINNQHRVIVDKEFSKRAQLRDEKEPSKWKTLPDDSVVTGKIFCANSHCRHHWGYRMRHKLCAFSVPKVTSFLFTNASGYRDTLDRWGLAPFEVSELTAEDMSNFPEEQDEGVEDEQSYE